MTKPIKSLTLTEKSDFFTSKYDSQKRQLHLEWRNEIDLSGLQQVQLTSFKCGPFNQDPSYSPINSNIVQRGGYNPDRRLAVLSPNLSFLKIDSPESKSMNHTHLTPMSHMSN